jgi:hypothetical protein
VKEISTDEETLKQASAAALYCTLVLQPFCGIHCVQARQIYESKELLLKEKVLLSI